MNRRVRADEVQTDYLSVRVTSEMREKLAAAAAAAGVTDADYVRAYLRTLSATGADVETDHKVESADS